MKCKEANNLISPYMDGELPAPLRQELEFHLNSCQLCWTRYKEMTQLSRIFKSFGEEILPAPDGFKDQVLLRIKEKHNASRPESMRNLIKSWKKTAAAAAAMVIVALAGFNFALPWGMQIADNQGKPVVNNPAVNKAAEKNNPDNSSTTPYIDNSTEPGEPGSIQEPGSNTGQNAGSDPATEVEPPKTENPPVLLNAGQQNIKTTLLKIAVFDTITAPVETAVNIAHDMGGQSENLGQQVKDNVTYTQLKITVSREAENDIINKLSKLGTIYSKEEDFKDISSAYTNTLEQYYNLNSQKSGTKDKAELEVINSKLNNLIDKLGAFQQQAEKVTIVLWLQQ
jgi:hypothetical protein